MSVNKEMIENIRKNCLHSSQEFHPSDVHRIETNDWTIERFILVNKTEEAALNALTKAMKWRKSFGVNDFTDEYFPEEIYKIGECVSFCLDKKGHHLVWFIMNRHHKSSELGTLINQFMVYNFEKVDRLTQNQGWAMICDATDSGLSNVDMDYSRLIIEVLQSYYPRGCKYMVCLDIPFILNATAKLIISFMNEELKNIVKFVKKSELTEYLDQEYIPVHLKGNYSKKLVDIPVGVKPLEQLSHTKFSADQIKKIRSTFKKELD